MRESEWEKQTEQIQIADPLKELKRWNKHNRMKSPEWLQKYIQNERQNEWNKQDEEPGKAYWETERLQWIREMQKRNQDNNDSE
jgi:hypothetical protein